VQVARSVPFRCAIAVALCLMVNALGTPQAPAQDRPAAEAKPTAGPTPKPKPKAKAAARKKAEVKAKSKAKSKTSSKAKPAAKPAADAKAKAEPAATAAEEPETPDKDGLSVASREEPKLMTAAKLPKPIRTLHTCAADNVNVEVSLERYAKSVVFFVTCPPERGKLDPIAVYVARDERGTAARRVTFEIPPAAEGAPAEGDVIYSAVAAREAYTNPGDSVPHAHVRNDPPWIAGAWRPDDRPGVCAVAAHWRLQGDKGELWYWEEASECPADASPNYQGKIDKKPPPLVMR
jgi:hypothetical protein